MVEINNQRKAFLGDMLAWSEGTDNGRQKTRKPLLYGRHCSEHTTDYSDRIFATCRQTQNLQINRRRTLPASFPLVWCLPQSAWPERLLSKSQDAVALQQIKERGALPMIDRGDIRQAIDRCSNICFTAGRQGGFSFSLEHKAGQPDCKIQRSGRNGQRDWCMSRVTAIISALAICIIVCLSWAVNHYRDNAITYKAQRDKNARELEAGERGNYWHADASAWCCCARCKTHEGVSRC